MDTFAAGFAIQEQSITGLGRAFAGSAAVAEDASTLFFNPAGLTQLKVNELIVGLNYIHPKSDFDNQGSTLPENLGSGLIPGITDDGGKDAFVPNFYYAHRLNDKTVAGLGINAPFGLVTEYDDDWVGRYHAIKSDLKTININPAIAFQATEKLSVGFGINLQYIDLELTQAVDVGTACQIAGGAVAAACSAPTANDGNAKLTADDISWGYNLGVIYQMTDATRLGLHYRSKVSHSLKGDGEWTLPTNAQPFANALGFIDGNISGDIDLPESALLAIHQQISTKWSIQADAMWTRWSRFQELKVDSAVANLNILKEERWENSMKYALGLTYQYGSKWTFRGGIAYDETPVSDSQHRIARIPDNDRKWASIGASYQYKDYIIIDAGYTHIFVSEPEIDEIDDKGYTLKGKYEGSVDLIGLQMRWLFP